MKTNRLVAGGVALALVAAIVGLAVVAGRDSGGGPAVLPVLGTGGAGGATESMAADGDADRRFGGGVEYRVAGKLPGLDGEADAWRVPATELTTARVAELAGILGVEGAPRRTEFGWSVGSETRRLDVQDVAGNPWSLYEAMPEPAVAEAEARRAEAEARRAEETTVFPAPDADCAADACDQPMEAQRPADLPSRDEAERIGRRLLAELGVDLDQAAVRVDDAVTMWAVNADPVVGGLPTIGLSTSVSIGSDGVITYANGWLGEFTRGDRYPLIGTAAGLEKLNSEQMSVLLVDPAPGADGTQDVEPFVIEITGVRLGLQLFSTFERGADGHLVPSYLFSTADGGELPVIAIGEEYLAETPQHAEDDPGTEVEPAPEPDAPDEPASGQCTSADGEGIAATVCATDGRVGEPLVVTVTAKGTMRDDCGSPVVEFGDAEGTAVCSIGCESLPPEPIELERSFEHVYAQPGAYDVVVQFRGCGADSGTDQLRVPILVRVEG